MLLKLKLLKLFNNKKVDLTKVSKADQLFILYYNPSIDGYINLYDLTLSYIHE